MLARRAAERGGALLNAARARRYFFPNMYNLRRREGGNPRKSAMWAPIRGLSAWNVRCAWVWAGAVCRR